MTNKGKVDFHACRVAYVNFVLKAGASVKEAQSLARHSDPRLTLNIYAKDDDQQIADITEAVGDFVMLDSNITGTEREKLQDTN